MMQRKKKAVDERIVREVNKVYRVAYYLFNIGLCIDLFLKLYGGQVQKGFEAFRYIGFEVFVLIGVNLAALVLLCRRGLMDDEAHYAESDRFPWKHYLIEALIAGAAVGLLACMVRAFGSGGLAGGPLASRDAVLHLLRARALWQAQRPDEARNALNAYLAAGGSRL